MELKNKDISKFEEGFQTFDNTIQYNTEKEFPSK